MNDYYQYRVTVNGTQGQIVNELPEGQWEQIAVVAEERGYQAKLERRFVTDDSFLEMNGGAVPGYIRLPNGTVISGWEVQASFNG